MTHFICWPYSELDLCQQFQVEHHSLWFSGLRYFLKVVNITLLKFHPSGFSNQSFSGTAFKHLIQKENGPYSFMPHQHSFLEGMGLILVSWGQAK